MTNKKKKRPATRPSGYRDPKPAPEPTPRRGILDSVFAPRSAGSSAMPRIRTALARGVVTVIGTPALVIGTIVFLLVFWLVLLALGYQGPLAPLANLLAIPPVGTSLDASLATSIFGIQGGLYGILGFLVVRAVVLGITTAAVVQVLDQGRVTRDCFKVGIRALPVTMAVCIIGVGILTAASVAGPLLGPGIGILLQFGGLIIGTDFFVFAPVIAVSEQRSMPDSLARSVRAARMPGVGNLNMAALYVVPAVALIVAPGKPGNLIGVNPSVGAWAFAILVNLLQLALLATFAFRYLSVAHEVPDAPVKAARSGARGRR
jgi:hypothetical protein